MQGIKRAFIKMKVRAEELHVFIISVFSVGKLNELLLRSSLRTRSQIQRHSKGNGAIG